MRGEARAKGHVSRGCLMPSFPSTPCSCRSIARRICCQPLVHALTHLDWPAAKLDIKLILEAVDDDDDRGGARARPSRQCRDRRGARAPAPHQAEGAELCAAARARRVSRDLRRRGPAGARSASPRVRRLPRGSAEPRLRAGQAQSLQRLRQLADAAVHARILRAVRRAVARARQLACRSRSAAPRTISACRR